MLPAESDGGSRASLRASDTDRDRCVEMLREQCGQGRITLAEFEERVDVVFSARTLAELDGVVNDLPVHVPSTAPQSAAPGAGRRAATRVSNAGRMMIAILGENTRRGRFRAPESMTAVALLGECTVDLTQASFSDGHLLLTAVATLGSITVIVADGVHVEMAGLALLGEKSCEVDSDAPLDGAPVVTVRALAMLGEIRVRVLTKKERIKREQRARA
ncbi:MAG: hypothetical protein QOG03_2346 [Actinomycetota bacterium]|nr:hypothetical protein [Actinomycetota bacterium]